MPSELDASAPLIERIRKFAFAYGGGARSVSRSDLLALYSMLRTYGALTNELDEAAERLREWDHHCSRIELIKQPIDQTLDLAERALRESERRTEGRGRHSYPQADKLEERVMMYMKKGRPEDVMREVREVTSSGAFYSAPAVVVDLGRLDSALSTVLAAVVEELGSFDPAVARSESLLANFVWETLAALERSNQE